MSYVERLFRATEDENRRAILSAVEPIEGGRMLDLGCASGHFTVQLARRARAAEVHGVEFVEEWAAAARGHGIEVVATDLAERLPYDDASFDLVHSNQVIEHLPRTDTFLREIRRVLRPGGHAIISTNNLASWHNVVSLALGWQPTPCHVSDYVIVGNPTNAYDGWEQPQFGQQHLRVFTGRALAALAGYHGLALDLDRTAGYYPLPARAARAMTRIDRRHGAFLVQRYVPVAATQRSGPAPAAATADVNAA
ncbi:MAG: class I SAM-dependent methyltransferase [Solirubrobacteraceae bacterium]|nr:class I SAM-dependent methyltransferase [Solirubrobacteraceae bacterium]